MDIQIAEYPSCANCGASVGLFAVTVDEVSGRPSKRAYYECSECHIVFLFPQPTDRELRAYYDPQTYYAFHPAQSRSRFRKKANTLEAAVRKYKLIQYWGWPQVPLTQWERRLGLFLALAARFRGRVPDHLTVPWREHARILDIGASTGETFLHPLKQMAPNWEFVGIELDSQAATKGRERFGLDIRTGPIESFEFPADRFDVIALLGILEHVRRPVELLQRVHKWLADDGLLLLHTPNLGSPVLKEFGSIWPCFEDARHLYHFNTRTLENLLRSTGFEPGWPQLAPHQFEIRLRYELLGAVARWRHLAVYAPKTLYPPLPAFAWHRVGQKLVRVATGWLVTRETGLMLTYARKASSVIPA